MNLLQLNLMTSVILSLLASAVGSNDEVTSPTELSDTLVICPVEFQPSLAEWIRYRQQQGHSIQVLRPAERASEVKLQIQKFATEHPLKFVFLIGDVRSPGKGSSVPIPYVKAEVTPLFGSEPEIATDNPYADLDGDGLPELALGRLPADSAEEVRDFLDRVIAYESNSARDQSWRRNINFVAGVGGFGGLLDHLLEQTAKQIITQLVPHHYQTTMTFGSWRSPFCPDPRQFSQTAIGRFNEGCLFWVYIGHGQPTKLDRVKLPDQSHSILDQQSARQICCVAGNPIAIFLSCYTGAIDHREDCLAETMLRQPCGPIATICGTRVTMPYALSLLSLEIVNEYFAGDVATLGELMCQAKRRIVTATHDQDPELKMEPEGEPESEQYGEMIRELGKLVSPRPDLLRAECLEHAHLIQLLGDPLLRLKRPAKIELNTPESAESGRELTISGIAPNDGELSVELVYRRDRFRHRPPYRPEFVATDQEFRSYQTVYEDAHDLICDQRQQTVARGRFDLTLRIPADTRGQCVVRCMLNSPIGFGLGSKTIEIQSVTGNTSVSREDFR